MNHPSPSRPLNLSALLGQVLEEPAPERLTIGELSAHLRDRAWGGLLLIFAGFNLLPLPPGTTSISGIPLIIITAQMASGRARLWLPAGLDKRGMTRKELALVMGKLLSWERRIEAVLKPRLPSLTNHRGCRVIGLVSLLLSIILWLPIPLGNHAPAFTMCLFALALLYRDGIVAIAGYVAAAASLVLVSLVIGAAWLATVVALKQGLALL